MSFPNGQVTEQSWASPNRVVALFILATIAIVVSPFLLVTYLPLVDIPNHIARIEIEAKYDRTPAFQESYVVTPEPLPNLAFDMVGYPVARMFDAVVAAKIYILLAAACFIGGCLSLERALHGQVSFVGTISCLFFYNAMLLYGFINYLMGVALFLVAFSLWVRWQPAWSVSRVVMLAALFTITYLAHMGGYAALGLAIAAYSLYHFVHEKRPLRAISIGLIPFLPAITIVLAFFKHTTGKGHITWGTIREKAIALFPFSFSYDYALDAVCLLVVAMVLAGLAWRSRGFIVNQPILYGALVLFLAFILCPKQIFTGSGADGRFVPPAMLLLIHSFRWRLDRRVALAGFLVIWCVLSARVVAISAVWKELDVRIGGAVALMEAIPQHSSVYPIFPEIYEVTKPERALLHVPTYAVWKRQAVVPMLFAIPGQQLISFREHQNYVIAGRRGWISSMRDYDFIWAYKPSKNELEELKRCCRVVRAADDFSVWDSNLR